MTKKRLLVSALVSVVLAMPVGGFVFGFIYTLVFGSGNPLVAIFVGAFYAILTPVTLGFPPENLDDHAPSYNTWPYIIIAGLAVFGIYTAFAYYKNHPKLPS